MTKPTPRKMRHTKGIGNGFVHNEDDECKQWGCVPVEPPEPGMEQAESPAPMSAREFYEKVWSTREEVEKRLRREQLLGTLDAAFNFAETFAAQSQPSVSHPRKKWNCFHCEFATDDDKEAAAHFGDRDDAEEFKPLCKWWDRLTEDERVETLQDTIQQLNDALEMSQPSEPQDEQVKHMVERFLGWKLPDNFSPDGGISFTKMYNEHTAHPMKREPVGTNLFDYTQAEQMVRYMLAGEQRAIPECQHCGGDTAKGMHYVADVNGQNGFYACGFDCHFSDTRPYLQHKRDCAKFRAKDDGPGLRLAFWDDKKPCTCGLAKLKEKYGRSK